MIRNHTSTQAVASAIVVAIVACTPAPSGWAEAGVIVSLREGQNAAIAAHDLDRIAATWTSDVTVVASSGTVHVGVDAYRDALRSVFESFPDAVYERIPLDVRPASADGMALERGTWTGGWTDQGTAVRLSGEYLAQWRHEGDGWKIRAELFAATEDNRD